MLEILLDVVELDEVHRVRGSTRWVELLDELSDARDVPARGKVVDAEEADSSRDVVFLAAHLLTSLANPSNIVAHGSDTIGTFNQLTQGARSAK